MNTDVKASGMQKIQGM